MTNVLFYDCEIAKCIPSGSMEWIDDPEYEYCSGWDDFENMGIAVIGYYSSLTKSYNTVFDDDSALKSFQEFVYSHHEIVGFNSKSFDDLLMAANGIKVETTYDLLCEVRIASGQPPYYQRGLTRAGYNLEALARTNLGKSKTGRGDLAPMLWQQGKKEEVIQYCLNDVELLVELWKRRENLIDPTDGSSLKLRT